MHEPYTYLNGLTVSDLEDLLVDINVYEKIDLDRNKEFWTDIVTIVNDELHKLRKLDAGKSQYEEAAERRQVKKYLSIDICFNFFIKSFVLFYQILLFYFFYF